VKKFARILAIDCGASHVACGRFSGGPDRPVLEQFASTMLPASDLTEEAWVDAVGDALRELKQAGWLRGECVLGLPGHLTFNRLLRVPDVTGRQRRKIIEFEQRQENPTAIGELVWGEVLATDAGGGQELMLAAAKRHIIEKLEAKVRSVGLYPQAALPAWLALRHAVGCLPPAEGAVLVLSVGARSSQLVLQGAGRFFARTFAFGGNLATQKLAEELQLDFPSAEALKLRRCVEISGSEDGLREREAGRIALDQFVRRLCAELQCFPPLALPEGDPARPTTLFLTGGGGRLAELPGALAARLQLRVEWWHLPTDAGPAQAKTYFGGAPDECRLADLTGLAACAAKGPPEEGNLLPVAIRRELFFRRRWPWLAGAALVGIAAGQVPAWRWQGEARDVQRQSAEMDARIADIHRIDARNRLNLAQLAEIRRRISALQRLEVAQSAWITLLGELQVRLATAQDAWLDRLQVLPAEVPAVPSRQASSPGRSADGLRVLIAGSIFDPARPVDRAADGCGTKATALLEALRGSPLISAVEHEHFDDSQQGLLRFEVTLRLAAHAPD